MPTFTTAQLAQQLEAELVGDGSMPIHGFAPAESAQAGHLTFAENDGYLAKAEQGNASAVLAGATMSSATKTLLRVKNPRVAFAKVLPLFFPEPQFAPGVHPTSIVATSAQPMTLISRDANIKSIKDFGPNDKIAVPTVKVSTQAIVLQIAAAEAFGADQWSKLDVNTVQLGHPDAYVALTNAQHEVRNHFSIPPFTFLELKNVPGAHVVLSSPDVMGGPLSQAQFFTTTKFADANPKIVQAVRDATREAQDLIRSDTRTAVEIYKEVTGDKTSVEDLLAWLKEPGMMEWNLQPQGTMKFAAHLFKTGTLKTQPKAWTDYYLPVAHDLKGN